MTGELTCERCGASFTLPESVRERYPGWTPSYCQSCYRNETTSGSSGRGASGRHGPVDDGLTVADVLDRYTEGPTTGVFTDGSAQPNPGPGGWGAVYVVDDEVVAQDHGHEPDTTNNRMELTALIHGCDLVPHGTAATLYTDSRLAHDTITKWAEGWKRRGWKRKRGPVKNLDLVKELYERLHARPELELAWVPGHAGYRWNEYADALSTAWMRDEV